METKQWKDVLHIISGKNQKAVENPNGNYPIYGSGGIIGYADDYLCEGGTTIVGRKGTINKPIFVNEPFWNIDTAFGIAPGKNLNPWYLYYFCLYFNFMPLDKSTGRPSLAKSDLLKIKMPVPSLSKQEQIVKQIEESLSQLDSAVETLKKTKQQLEVYRQAVLKEAFYGSNKVTQKCCKISDFADVGTGATPLRSNKEYYSGSIPWVKSAKINDKKIYSPTEYITEKALKETNCKLYPPHTLLVAMYGEGKTRGKCAELMITAATNQALAAIELKENSIVIKDFLKWYLIYNYGNIRLKSSGGVQPNINLSIIKNIRVPIFSISEQQKTVNDIDEKMTVCDSIEQTVNQSLQQAEALRQSILNQAFEG